MQQEQPRDGVELTRCLPCALSQVQECMDCKAQFSFLNRRHHCRLCGGIFCGKCTTKQTGQVLNHSQTQALTLCHPCALPTRSHQA
jgi:hypothetical protein